MDNISSKHLEAEELIKELLNAHNAEDRDRSTIIARRLLCDSPSLKIAWNILAIALARSENYKLSILTFARAVHLDPYSYHLHNNIANVLKANKIPERAAVSYKQSIALNPLFHLAYFNFAELSLNEGEVGIRLLKKCLLIHQGFANALLLLSEKLIAQKRYTECVEWLKSALDSPMGFYEIQIRLISCLFEIEDYAECRQRSQRLIEVDPAHDGAYLSLALTNQELGLSSKTPLNRAALLSPESSSTKLMVARHDIDEGHFQSAKDRIESVLNHDPCNAIGLSLIPLTKKMKREEADWLKAATLSASRDNISGSERISLLFSIGKYYDDIMEYDRAFHFYEQANNAALEEKKDARKENIRQLYDAIIQSHDSTDISTPILGHSKSQLPIFIVGMPRSGSSLIEQILASHPQIAGAGELPFWPATIKNLEKEITHPQLVPRSKAREIIEKYISIISEFNSERVVDKSLVNFIYIGYILALFPNAKIIHAHRDPIDTCLSIYFSNFGIKKHPYSYKLEDLKFWYFQYHKLMKHWISILPEDRILNVAYEGVVNDPDFWTRKALSFVELPYHPQCANFFNTERRVHTSSNWQVRQPIYNSSLSRWRNYAQHIAPILDLSTKCPF